MTENEGWRQNAENEPLFSRSIKAGKRVYYIDVKRDRRDEYYIAMTESKRVQEGTESERPVFERHKIFLYREDIMHFVDALNEAVRYVGDKRPLTPHEYPETAQESPAVADESDKIELGSDFNIEF